MESPSQRQLFQRRNEKIDWRKLAAVDIEKITREIDVDAIQGNILNVTYCHIEHELGSYDLDPNFVKLFRLAQLTIEYLLHCQEYLQQCIEDKDTAIKNLNEEVQKTLNEHENTKNELSTRNTAYKNLKKEYLKSKKMIGDYQLMIRAGASGLHKCTCCEKSFVSEPYLRSHLERRHPDEAKRMYPNNQSTQKQSLRDVELQNELNDIKTRLQTTENQLMIERQSFASTKAEETQRNKELLDRMTFQHNQWKQTEQEAMKREIENFKEMMLSELKQSQIEKKVMEMNLQELQNTIGKKKSTLGLLMDEDEQTTYQDLEERMAVMEKNMKRQIEILKEQHKKDEDAAKIVYNKKIEKEKATREKMAVERQREQKYYEEQIALLRQKLAEHDEIIDRNKVSYGREEPKDVVDAPPSVKPPASPRPVVEKVEKIQDEPVQIEQDLPEKDSINLWVSVNANLNHQSYRLIRQAASTKGEWKDLFSFSALTEPVGQFQKAIYVYSCGGSPYWRQYISSSEYPPRPNYKHDFTFYVTATSKLIGTTKIFVLDSGSGTVVRSRLSKDESVENWKSKGLSFYAMKPNQSSKGNISQSGTFNNSEIFDVTNEGDENDDDDDDLSVSSFTGTDDVKQNLAEDIKRSRENLLQGDSNTAKEYEEEQEIESESVDGKDEADGNGNFVGTSSGSFLSSTLPEKGEFYPYPDNPLAVARYDHSDGMLAAQRKEIQDILEDHLEKRGVDPDETRMSSTVFLSKMKHHGKEAQLKEKNFPGFTKYREKLRQAVEDFSASQWAKRTSNKTSKKLKAAAQAIKSVSRMSRTPEKKPQQQKRGYTEDLNVQLDPDEREYTLTRYQRSLDDDEEDDDDERIEEVSEKNNEEEENDNENFEVSESWKTESGDEDDDVEELIPQINVHQPTPNRYVEQEEPYRPKLRSPKGAKVRELAKSLESSLTLRDKSKKKLAGAVDLHDTMENDDDREDNDDVNDAKNVDDWTGEKPKRSVSFRDAAQYHGGDDNIEDDDESDFSLNSYGASKTNSGVKRSDENDDDDDDLHEILGLRKSPSLAQQKPSASSTPYSNRPSSGGEIKVKGREQTPVTQLSLEDFDDESF